MTAHPVHHTRGVGHRLEDGLRAQVRRYRAWLGPCVLLTAGLLLPARALAVDVPETQSWRLCFLVSLQSCNTFTLMTQPLFFEGTDIRIGTFLDVTVRHDDGLAAASALYSVSFGYYAPSDPQESTGDGMTPGLPLTPSGVGGAPTLFEPDGWGVDAFSFQGVPEWTYFHLYNAFFGPGPDGLTNTQVIAGCGLGAAGALDSFFATALSTCADGEHYRFQFETDAIFRASLFRSIQVDVFGMLHEEVALGAWTCTAYLDGSPSFGVDFETGESGDFCHAVTLGPGGPVAVTEPGAMVLLLTGLAGVAGVSGIRGTRKSQSPAGRRVLM